MALHLRGNLWINIKAIELKNITKKFSGVPALDNVSLEINKNEIHALVGENGAGKSTLMNVLCGILIVAVTMVRSLLMEKKLGYYVRKMRSIVTFQWSIRK